jgi:hypothetical protein
MRSQARRSNRRPGASSRAGIATFSVCVSLLECTGMRATVREPRFRAAKGVGWMYIGAGLVAVVLLIVLLIVLL